MTKRCSKCWRLSAFPADPRFSIDFLEVSDPNPVRFLWIQWHFLSKWILIDYRTSGAERNRANMENLYSRMDQGRIRRILKEVTVRVTLIINIAGGKSSNTRAKALSDDSDASDPSRSSLVALTRPLAYFFNSHPDIQASEIGHGSSERARGQRSQWLQATAHRQYQSSTRRRNEISCGSWNFFCVDFLKILAIQAIHLEGQETASRRYSSGIISSTDSSTICDKTSLGLVL